jgi:hypothetical protein
MGGSDARHGVGGVLVKQNSFLTAPRAARALADGGRSTTFGRGLCAQETAPSLAL